MRLGQKVDNLNFKHYPSLRHNNYDKPFLSTSPPLDYADNSPTHIAMYSSVGRTALRASRRQFTQATRRTYAVEAQTGHPEDRAAGTQALKKGAKRDPELMV